MKDRPRSVCGVLAVLAVSACGGAPSRPPSLDLQSVAPVAAPAATEQGAKVAGGGLGQKEIIPLALKGDIYFIPENTRALPDFAALKSVGSIYAARLDVTPRGFETGFPGVTDRFEWFAIDYHGTFAVDAAGKREFRLTSDDGAKLFIDDRLVIDDDGVHSPLARQGSADLAAGAHTIRVEYFQGPRTQIALVLEMSSDEGKTFAPFDATETQGIEVRRAPGKLGVSLGGELLFGFDKSDLGPQAEAVLARVKSDLIDAHPGAHVIVEGHTDDKGDDAYNLDLSNRRAASVVSWLGGHGVDPARLEPLGYGMRFPKVPNTSPANRAKNRRVEIVLTGGGI
ncbi:MAG: OmpA family protein [Byssovorax sp.]